MLIVDNRWRGKHGIGRFAIEVVERLQVPWRPLGGGLSPTAPRDILNMNRLLLKPEDIIYSPGFNAGITRATQLLNIHDLIHLQIESERTRAKTLFYNLVVRRAVIRAGVVMTDSRASASAIARWIGSHEVQIVVVGCGRSKYFVPQGDRVDFDCPTFVYVGNLKPHKNVNVLLEAFALRPSYHLTIVTGDAELAASKVEVMGLGARVSIRTRISDKELAAIYRGATGALQPSLLEGFGLPALEAMSCGTRVAYWSGCESVSEICAGTGVAVHVSTNAVEWGLALDALILMEEDGPLSMPSAWEEQYDWDTVAAKTQQVLWGADVHNTYTPSGGFVQRPR